MQYKTYNTKHTIQKYNTKIQYKNTIQKYNTKHTIQNIQWVKLFQRCKIKFFFYVLGQDKLYLKFVYNMLVPISINFSNV
jgi:hypothetical protein